MAAKKCSKCGSSKLAPDFYKDASSVSGLSSRCKACYHSPAKNAATSRCMRKRRESNAYMSWEGMKQRCTNPHAANYKKYGGRGISVCDRWLSSYENFHADMGDRPEGHSLDRIDVNGNYNPDNCRWADNHTQRMNQRPRANKAA